VKAAFYPMVAVSWLRNLAGDWHAPNPLPRKVSGEIFTITNRKAHAHVHLCTVKIRAPGRSRGKVIRRSAPKMRQVAVDGLHSIDFSAHKTPPFLLTLRMKGVKTNSFFDSF
jgi:hypothetical protein